MQLEGVKGEENTKNYGRKKLNFHKSIVGQIKTLNIGLMLF